MWVKREFGPPIATVGSGYPGYGPPVTVKSLLGKFYAVSSEICCTKADKSSIGDVLKTLHQPCWPTLNPVVKESTNIKVSPYLLTHQPYH